MTYQWLDSSVVSRHYNTKKGLFQESGIGLFRLLLIKAGPVSLLELKCPRISEYPGAIYS